MPTYDFACRDCGESFTVRVSMSAKKDVSCPSCQKTNITQKFTGFLYTKPSSDAGNGSSLNDKSCAGSACRTCAGC